MKVTLTNSFHGTSIELLAKDGFLSTAQVKKARKTLCGISDCTCCNNAGQRGDGVELKFYQDNSAEVVGGYRVQHGKTHYVVSDYDTALNLAIEKGIASEATITEMGTFYDRNR